MKALILGVTGQDGSYLAEILLDKGYEVHGMVRRSATGNTRNIEHIQDRLILHRGDLADSTSLYRIIRTVAPRELYNEADQDHVRWSFDTPEYSYDITGSAVGRLLEIVRQIDPSIKVFQPCTSNMFGKVTEWPQTEETPFKPQSPYACAKLLAYVLAQHYRETYGMFVSTAILYNHESPRRTEEYVTRKITRAAARIKAGLQDRLSLGDLSAVVDWGYAKEYMEAAWTILQQQRADDYIIATGETHTVREWLDTTFELAGIDPDGRVNIDAGLLRPGNPALLVGNTSKARKAFGFDPQVKFRRLIEVMLDADLREATGAAHGKGISSINVCEPSLSDLEKRYVQEALEKNWLSSIAPPVHLFEEAFARRWNAKHAVAVNSGGSALFLALWSLGVREGDEVIMPAFTMVATAGAVTQCGAKPVFVDSEPGTGNIDVSLIEERITTRTKMIMPVHIYGHPCDMDPIRQLTRDYGLLLVEDAAESHGALYRGKQVGMLGNAGCFSFYANKIMTSGEGGMIVTDDDQLAHRVRHARAYDFDEARHFWHKSLAWNLRMSALEAAVGRAQLERLDELIDSRRRNAASYTEHLGNLVTPLESKSYATTVSWMYGILVRDLDERDGLMNYLARNDVETRTFFLPMHQQPVYKSAESFPVAEDLGRRGLYLPSSSHLSTTDKDTVIRHVRDYLRPRR